MKYKIEFYSPLLNKRVVRTVDKLEGYEEVVILEIIRPMPVINFFGLGRRNLWF